jgi:hypothetical protein
MRTSLAGPVRRALSIAVLAWTAGCGDAPAPVTPAPRSPPFKPVVETRLLMEAMIDPQADVIWQSVKTVVTRAGAKEFRPRTEAEWAQVLHAAATVTEAGNLLMMTPRARDNGGWMKASQALVESGSYAVRAAQAKNPDMLFDAGAVLYEACNACHRQYHWPPPPDPPTVPPRELGRAPRAR